MASDLEVEEAFMGATYRALCRHGYASLTMQDIADESDRSKAALHYHYDTKHDLLVAFLDYLYEGFTERIDAVETDDPVERLRRTVETVLAPPERTDDREFRTAMLELRAQAPYDDEYRERLAEFDRFLRERVRETVAAGVERGVFRADADPETEATFVVTVISGASTRRVTLDCPDCPVEVARSLLDERVESLLVAEGESRTEGSR
jgi:AcrR family transcriptional regulator